LQIRDAPQKGHHKVIEFYDVRAAEGAVRALNRSDLAGKKINLGTVGLSGVRRYAFEMLSCCSFTYFSNNTYYFWTVHI
jgi:hypothetical protein